MTNVEREVPKDLAKYLLQWRVLAISLQAIYVFFALLSSTSALAVATFTTELGDLGTRAIAFTSALSIAIITSFDLGKKASDVRTAWRLFNEACLKYKCMESFHLEDLITTYAQCEQSIGQVIFSPHKDPSNQADNL